MRKLFSLVLLALTIAVGDAQNVSQPTGTARRIVRAASLPATCTVGDVYFKTAATVGTYQCLTTNAWTAIAGSSGASPAGPTGALQSNGGGGNFAAATVANLVASGACPLSGCTMVGLSVVPMGVSRTGANNSVNYEYCVTATDANANTITSCPASALDGPTTLSVSNFYTITVSAWSAPLPVGACGVYRMIGGTTQGKIGTISSCSAGGNLIDTGLSGDSTSPPSDTSGSLITGVAAQNLAGYTFYTGNVSVTLTPANNAMARYWTHNAIFGNGTYTGSGITAMGYAQSASAHACTLIGYGAGCSGANGVVMGINSSVVSGGIAIGSSATNTAGEIAMGQGASVSGGNGSAAIGSSSTSAFTGSWAIGSGAITTKQFQTVLCGSSCAKVTTGNAGGAALESIGLISLPGPSSSEQFTLSGCSADTPVGGGTVGTFLSKTTGTCTVTITAGGSGNTPFYNAPNGWFCYAQDQTTPAVFSQTGSSTNTCTITATTTSGDLVRFSMLGY